MDTMIHLDTTTVHKLKDLGKKGHTYNDIITQLLAEHEELAQLKKEVKI